jgi:hypothetical protein
MKLGCVKRDWRDCPDERYTPYLEKPWHSSQEASTENFPGQSQTTSFLIAMDNNFLSALVAAGVSILQIKNMIILFAAARFALQYLGTLWNTFEPYYGDGGQARYT